MRRGVLKGFLARLHRVLEETGVLGRATRVYPGRRGGATRRMRGLVKPRLGMEELEEVYQVERR